jgi:hypothetical protein
VRDVEQLLKCFAGINIGFAFLSLGLVYFGDRRRVDILSFLGVERIRSLVEKTMLDTMGDEVAVCLCPLNRVVVLVEVCLELCARGCEVRVRVRLGERPEDGRP